MKLCLPIVILFASFSYMSAQCDDLFFSEYVEGYSSNKALEIYNPTDEAVNLSDYSIARASNGSTSPASNQIISLPDMVLEPNDVFVVVIDLRDTALWDSQFDKPAWNGYNLIDTIFDAVTNEPITDEFGNVILGPQYSENGSALFGSEYDEKYDLQCKADAFLCPEYNQNNTMYFNGNDAVLLIKGDAISPTGDNLLDVVGVIGEDPEDTIMEDAWVNEDGFWITKNRTLVRNSDITSGRNNLAEIVFALGGTFTGEEWQSYRNNSFEFLGIHNSDCNNEEQPDRYSCSQGPLSGTYGVNSIAFELYPNPVTNSYLNLSTEKEINSVEIFDLIGHRVYQKSLDNSDRQISLNISNLERGIYVIKISNSNREWSSKKIIIE